MVKKRNALEAQKAYCLLLKLIQDMSELSSVSPGASFAEILEKLQGELSKAIEELDSHQIKPDPTICSKILK